MPVTPTYPGVYIEEVPSGVRTITPVGTSLTAFVGGSPRGRADYPEKCSSLADFERKFGDIDARHPMGFAVRQYFLNGGTEALIVRVTAEGAEKAKVDANGLPLEVVSPGKWGDQIVVRTDLDTKSPENPNLFNLFAYDKESGALEEFRNVSIELENARFVKEVLEDESALIRIEDGQSVDGRPGASGDIPPGKDWFEADGAHTAAGGGNDGNGLKDSDVVGSEGEKSGFHALLKTNTYFSMMVLPPISFKADTDTATYTAAIAFLEESLNHKRTMLFVDAPSGWKSIDQAEKGVKDFRGKTGPSDQAAIFFPRAKMRDPLKEGRLREFTVAAAVAGVAARTDLSRGIWKSPAGIDATLRGIDEFLVPMNDRENGRLNPEGLNCLRKFPAYGNVVWGSRTMAGFDALGSEWKYLAVRRFALYLEENLYRGTQWVVFEPNDAPLWAQIRLNVGTFMQDLFRQGAFQGSSPQEAYFVKCDSTTTTQSDINRGIVNIEIGFAPLKPAEFVILKIKQIQKNN